MALPRRRSFLATLGGAVVLLLWAAPASPAFTFADSFTRTDYGTGANPSAITGDYLIAGNPDDAFIAVANRDSDNVTVLVSHLGSAFSAATGSPITVGDQPAAITTGHFNSGDDADLAVANAGSDTVSILLGNGLDGTFSPAGSPITVGDEPVGISAGDLDNDGDADLAVANRSSDNVTILLGDGTGGFTANSPITVGDEPVGIIALDWVPAVSVTNRASNSMSYIGDPAGTPAVTPVTTGIGTAPVAIASAPDRAPGSSEDFLAIANNGSGTVTMLRPVSPPFSTLTGSPFTVGTAPSGIAGGGIPGNGELSSDGSNPGNFEFGSYLSGFSDFSIANAGSDSISFLFGDGHGIYTPGTTTLATGDAPAGIVTGDFDADQSFGDLAVPNSAANTVSVFVNNRTPHLTVAPTSLTFPTQPSATLSGAQVVTITNDGGAPVLVKGVQLIGADPGDFVVSSDACHGYRLPAGYNATCQILVRFAPTTTGARNATLRVSDGNRVTYDVPVSGTGGALPSGPAGPAGPQGPVGPQGPAGRDATVKCKVKGSKKIKCKVVFTSAAGVRRARLSRDGLTFAEGKPVTRNGKLVLRFRVTRPLATGRYTLTVVQHLDGHRVVTKSPVSVR